MPLDPAALVLYNGSMLILASSSLQKMAFTAFVPLLALACLVVAILSLLRGVRMLVVHIQLLHSGLHASSTLPRVHADGTVRYIPVFSYTGKAGEEFDILGEQEYATEAEALKARRLPVYDAERPDAGVAANAFTLLMRPVLLLLLGCASGVLMLYLLSL